MNLDIFDRGWGGYSHYWEQHHRHCDNMMRMLVCVSPMDFLEDDLREDWVESNWQLRCYSAA